MADTSVLGETRLQVERLRDEGMVPVRIELGRREYAELLRASHGVAGSVPPDIARLRELWGVPVRLVDEESAVRIFSREVRPDPRSALRRRFPVWSASEDAS